MLVELSERADDTILPYDDDEGPLFGKVVGRLGERGAVTVEACVLLDTFAAVAASAPLMRHVSMRVSVAR